MPPLTQGDAAMPPIAVALREAARRAGDPPAVADALAHAAARLAVAAAEGHSCLPLSAADAALLDPLRASPLVRRSSTAASPIRLAPLILDDATPQYRLYFARQFSRETRVAEGLTRLQRHPLSPAAATRLTARLDAQFGDDPRQAGQKAAIARAAENGLTLIAGGPGTGKTTTVVTLLMVLRAEFPDLRIALAAPTGKAAARLAEALANGPPLQGDAPETGTLHRLLGIVPQPPVRPFARPPATGTLPWDLIVVDEASMIDLALAARLAERLRADTRLVLLGDPDQLASVEAGAVFAELVAAAASTDGPLTDALVRLTHSHRFDRDASLGQVADAVRRGDPAVAVRLLQAPDASLDRPAPEIDLDDLAAGYASYVRCYREWAACGYPLDDPRALAAFGRTRILAALRRGPQGVDAINAALDERLRPALTGVTARLESKGFPGQARMLVRNAPELGLFNGDTGLVISSSRGLAIVFPDPANSSRLRSVPLHHLPASEAAWANTIHKAQGSEFDTVKLILPQVFAGDAPSPILTRELLYTGLTRARQKIHLIASDATLHAAISRPTQRHAGLRARLTTIRPAGRE